MSEVDGQTEIERKLAEQEAAARAEMRFGAQPHYTRIAPAPARRKSLLEDWKDKGGILGSIAAGLIFVFKVFGAFVLPLFKFLLVFKGALLTFGSMAISMWAMSAGFGWPFAVGIVLLIFFHESGHAIAAIIKGHRVGPMVFIPFMGAFVTTSGGARSLEEDAYIGIMGPVFGTLAGVVCVVLAFMTHSQLFIGLAYFDFMMNLFNLAPTAPLDGGWIAPLFSPKLLGFGLILMILLGFRNPLIWVLGFMSIPRVIAAWNADPATQPYYRVSAATKWKFGFAYFGLAAFLGIAMLVLQQS